MTLPTLHGRAAWVFDEANFDVDRILGFEVMREHDAATLARGAMKSFDPGFAEAVRLGDLLIGGPNFGFGHPHGPPMAAMRRLGVAAVIAESFAPLYAMGEFASGFPQITCPGIRQVVRRWDVLEVDWACHSVSNLTRGGEIRFLPLSSHEQNLVKAGGLFNLLRSAPKPSRRSAIDDK